MFTTIIDHICLPHFSVSDSFFEIINIVSIVTQITMVAGSAWFSVSLASIKEKLESFGLDLTRDLFTAFTTSSLIHMLSVSASFLRELYEFEFG